MKLSDLLVTQSATRVRSTPTKPPLWTCTFVDDDRTPTEFVRTLLYHIFNQRLETVEEIVIRIRQHGRCAVGVWPREIAIEKSDVAIAEARRRNYPLQIFPHEMPPV